MIDRMELVERLACVSTGSTLTTVEEEITDFLTVLRFFNFDFWRAIWFHLCVQSLIYQDIPIDPHPIPAGEE